MATDVSVNPSRRALFGAGLGAIVAFAAQALGRPSATRAANGDAVILGTSNSATSLTSVSSNASHAFLGLGGGDWTGVRGVSVTGAGVWGHSSSAQGVYGDSSSVGVEGFSHAGIGVHGDSNLSDGVVGRSEAAAKSGVYGYNTASGGYGVFGRNDASGATGYLGGGSVAIEGHHPADGTGVAASSAASYGVDAYSANYVGVFGRSDGFLGVVGFAGDAAKAGVFGQSHALTGVLGFSGYGQPPFPPKTGVYGHAEQDSTSRGVYGRSTSGQGVRGYATTGTAGYFASAKPASLYTGVALRAVGRVKFDQCAGIATIASGTTSKTVSPAIDITSTSAIVATVMSNTATTLAVRRVATDTGANTFTIHISGTAPVGGLKVAWHVFG